MLKQNLKNILRLVGICFFLLILGFFTFIPSASSPTLAQSPWTTYEDNDPVVQAGYSEGDWQTVSIAEAVGGNLTWTDVPGAELVLYFEGSAIEILYSRGPEGGDFHISLDDMTWPPFNGYAEQYLYGTSIQQFNIAPGIHQLVITNEDGALWLEAIRVQNGRLALDESDLPLIHSDSFDSYDSTAWLLDHRKLLTPSGNEQVLHIIGKHEPLLLRQGNIEDLIIQVNFSINEGKFQLGVRQSGRGSYLLSVAADGRIELYRNDNLLETATLSFLIPGQWYELRLVVINDVLTLIVDNMEVIRVIDPDPLPSGVVMISDGTTTALDLEIDDLVVRGTIGESLILEPPTEAPLSAFSTLTAPVDPEIAYVFSENGQQDIYVMDRFGGNIFNVTHSAAIDWWPDWSPDGEQITFLSNQTGSFQLYTINVDGTGFRRLTSGSQSLSYPTWSPTGEEIAFRDTKNINIINVASGFVETLTEVPQGTYYGHLAWSPEGDEIAAEKYVPGLPTYYNIYHVNVNTGSDLQITTTGGEYPEWSPDGAKIVYYDTLQGLSIMNRDGVFQTQLFPYLSYYPSFSPDGSQIAFQVYGSGGAEIRTISVTGGQTMFLANGAMPDWKKQEEEIPPLDPVACVNPDFDQQVYLQQVADLNLTYDPWQYWTQYYTSLQSTPSLGTLAQDYSPPLPPEGTGVGNLWWEQLALYPLHMSAYSEYIYQRDIPHDCAIEFGAEGILQEIDGQGGYVDEQRVKLIGLREAAAGFEYGRGILTYERTAFEFTLTRLTLSETDIRLAALINFHEGSENGFGKAFNILYAWAVYDILFQNNKIYGLTPEETRDRTLRANWKETYNWIGGSSNAAINLKHESTLSNPMTQSIYTKCYQAAKKATEGYASGQFDPVARGASAQSQPQLVISELITSGYSVTPELLAEGIIDYNQKVQWHYGDSTTQGVANYLMFRGTFFRVENGNRATTMVNWEFHIPDNGEPLDKYR